MSSSSSRYTESNIPSNQRIHVPIRRLSNNSKYEFNNQISSKDTTLQWINDPITGVEKFQIQINIEGFNQNEVIIFLPYLNLLFHLLYN
jgi:hypothetical protein